MRAAVLAFAATVLAAPVSAQDAGRFTTLDEAMRGATAMAEVGNGFLFVAKPDEAWVCPININSAHFAALVRRDYVVVEQTVPGAFCVPATDFQNLME